MVDLAHGYPALEAAALAQLHAGAEQLWQTACPWLPGLAVEVLPEVDSTNAELLRRARSGHSDPLVLVALRQSAGRGRLGRPWITPPGAALAMSIGLLLQPQDWSGLSLAVGVATAEALHPAVQLKWPNDLVWRDQKLGGILIETAAAAGDPATARRRYAVIGIGVNLATPALPPDTPPDALPPVGLNTLRQAHEQPGCALGTVLSAVGAAVLQAVLAFERDGLAPWLPRYAARDALQGRCVRLSDGTTGTAAGLHASGALRLRTATGEQRVLHGEVRVRPC